MYNYLSEENIKHFIQSALAEDVGPGDFTSLATIPSNAEGKAKLLVKEEGILAGLELALHVFKEVDANLKVEVFKKDGDFIQVGEIVLHVFGNSQSILKAERLVLNCMQRMSGIATYTKSLCNLMLGTNAKLLDTRKTTPNFRIAEKWACKIGGAVNHRYGLFDMILIKDNHIDYSGGISSALQNTFTYLKTNQLNLQIEIEVRSMEELREVLEIGGVKRILLDNFSPDQIRDAVRLVNKRFETEASGGINEKTLRSYAETGVDYISMGALTHQVKSLDLSLKAF
ncbi:carboxylating nicotinate-nucleotide diphosphorylase [Sandaracinomonas limnophila]|uniref:Probable nicotinate-nucleotide pyrophosphorylase [carboxylating] n=1 Tax=Sandaracinomonas limnophila TaxID=1862386 RepID=A0A437PNL8_9BACT|nr:carboxylating nicotinate-nucleotide diphosphorylase [Sandaracinomonas limnophila]RVU23634.1 carboxylating nicotinate-nucleotide diphosphorylase [Sandaracinomonas limnophila]